MKSDLTYNSPEITCSSFSRNRSTKNFRRRSRTIAARERICSKGKASPRARQIMLKAKNLTFVLNISFFPKTNYLRDGQRPVDGNDPPSAAAARWLRAKVPRRVASEGGKKLWFIIIHENKNAKSFQALNFFPIKYWKLEEFKLWKLRDGWFNKCFESWSFC